MTPQEQVTEFHCAFGVPIGVPWNIDLGVLRARLIAEEFQELDEALVFGPDLARIAQELADLAYVTIGTAATFGMDPPAEGVSMPHDRHSLRVKCANLCLSLLLGEVFSASIGLRHIMRSLYYIAGTRCIDLNVAITAVHEANMRKLGPDGLPILRPDGKILKPPGWIGPDLTAALMVAP